MCRKPRPADLMIEKLRNRADGAGAVPFEANFESFVAGGREGIRWSSHDLVAPILKRAAQLFADGLTVQLIEPSIYAPRAGCEAPEPAWKDFADFKNYVHPRQPAFKG